jgi:hypothetical protein
VVVVVAGGGIVGGAVGTGVGVDVDVEVIVAAGVEVGVEMIGISPTFCPREAATAAANSASSDKSPI